MGALLGLVFGIGLLLIWRSGPRRPPRSQRSGSWSRKRNEMLRQAGVDHLQLRTDRDWLLDLVRFVVARRERRAQAARGLTS